jgi:hypothetical protein
MPPLRRKLPKDGCLMGTKIFVLMKAWKSLGQPASEKSYCA